MRGYGARVLTAFAIATADPATPWWVTFLATVGPVIGVIIGALLGPLVEPWKLGAAHRAHIRKERLVQCARLMEAASQTLSGWITYVEVRIAQAEKSGSPRALLDLTELLHHLQEQRKALRGSVTQLALYGPDDLAAAAKVIRDRDSNLRRMADQVKVMTESGFELTGELEIAVEVFSKIAQKHTR